MTDVCVVYATILSYEGGGKACLTTSLDSTIILEERTNMLNNTETLFFCRMYEQYYLCVSVCACMHERKKGGEGRTEFILEVALKL